MKLNINDTFSKQLPADTNTDNKVRQVNDACFSYVKPTASSSPSLIHVSDEMLEEAGITRENAASEEFVKVFSGNSIYPNTQPYAMRYGGHQFGSWAGQLGDGRAINLFEVNNNNQQWAFQIKGAGKTPYSRSADGLAVLRSSIREYLCSEAMHHLGVPTTRALSIILSGDEVLRDVLYNGNAAYEKGAIVCRVAPSFIRFGNFQILAAHKELENLKKLTDYTITQFLPHLGSPGKKTYLKFLKEVAERTMDMVLDWERVGFVHGVMNTDNMSVLGLTIDYGPYGWLEDYDPNWTPNTTDAGRGRYRFGNQGQIALWNLYQFANALVPLINDVDAMEQLLLAAEVRYEEMRLSMKLAKLGLSAGIEKAESFIQELERLLHKSEMDMTLFFRNLSSYDGIVSDAYIKSLAVMSYADDFSRFEKDWKKWFTMYSLYISKEDNSNRKEMMNSVNPKYVLRNYMAQLAIDAADNGDYSVVDELFQLLKKPYDEQPENEKWFAKRPDWAKHKVGCSQLSCSS
ncbi:YdiU family protein [Lacibacter sp. MH-610]|jgi:uncharacterized protein YdiU (UPF0061 family)|uniref:protein adenylyltransferase SelO n=1 Tax=Chitinophagaceae TaxID=563835 RepID=UPI000A534681|nr:YdiU family protein [Chitinophagales bacterium]